LRKGYVTKVWTMELSGAEYEKAMTFEYSKEDMDEDNARYDAECKAHEQHIAARTPVKGCGFCDEDAVTNEEGITD
jgi:hypothetical protein